MSTKRLLAAALGAALALGATAHVKPGIEVLRDRGFEGLKGKRVGLITNPTGVDNNLRSTIDILHEAPGPSWDCMLPSTVSEAMYTPATTWTI